LKGTIALQSEAGHGTRIALALPVTLATLRVLIVQVNGHCYGLPAQSVQGLRMVAGADVFTVEGRNAVLHQGRPVSVALLADLLELVPVSAPTPAPAWPCVMLAGQFDDELHGTSFGVFVDALLDEQEIVLKPHSALLGRVRNVAGAAILDSGEICMVLDAADLLASLRALAPALAPAPASIERKKTILLVDDSIATRTQEARILMDAGYEVATAVDGQDAWQQLAARPFDAVVSDIVMPNLDGIGLTEKIRSDARHAQLPVILVTMLESSADRRRGLEAGADAYIAKAGFDQQALLDCLERLT
jgi:two-component system chemotaxis sensor kinase CheA